MRLLSHQLLDATRTPGMVGYVWPHVTGAAYKAPKPEMDRASAEVATILDAVKTAHHFDCSPIVDAVSIELVQTAVDMAAGIGIGLPFEKCFFDFGKMPQAVPNKIRLASTSVRDDDGFSVDYKGDIHICLLAEETADEIVFRSISKSSLRSFWTTYPIWGVLKRHASNTDELLNIRSHIPLEEVNEPGKFGIKAQSRLLLAAIALLETKHITIECVEPPKFANRKRVEKGLPRIPEYSVVRIDYKTVEKPVGDERGTHASPHLHWRRGHDRHLASGKIVRVRACLVGDPTKGFAKQDYRFMSPSQN